MDKQKFYNLIIGGYNYQTSPWGWRSSGFHYGEDRGTSGKSLPLYAPCDCVVAETGVNARSGNYLWLKISSKVNIFYCHLRVAPVVKAAQKVRKGQLLGYVGTTGNSTGIHLHFGVKIDGISKNPANWIATFYPYEKYKVIASPGLRVRTKPSISGSILEVIPTGIIVKVYETVNGWARIHPTESKWVSMKYLTRY